MQLLWLQGALIYYRTLKAKRRGRNGKSGNYTELLECMSTHCVENPEVEEGTNIGKGTR